MSNYRLRQSSAETAANFLRLRAKRKFAIAMNILGFNLTLHAKLRAIVGAGMIPLWREEWIGWGQYFQFGKNFTVCKARENLEKWYCRRVINQQLIKRGIS